VGFTLITTHENSDLDALASAVAAQRLHPGARIGLGRQLSPSVRRFVGLHRRRFPVERCANLPLDEVDRLVVTDVRRRSRLKHVTPVLERDVALELWDHHPAASDDLSSPDSHVEMLGAVTTLLCEELRAREVSIDPMEATLFALGIHEDTGGFTYAQTTARDAAAFAWLLEQGAVLDAIRRFIDLPISSDEQTLVRDLLDGVEPLSERVAITTAEVPRHLRGVARLVSEVLQLISYDALFALFAQGKRTQVIGRARGELVDVGGTLRHLGGGGHPGAGAAIVKAPVEEVRAMLVEHLGDPRAETVASVMSTEVVSLHRDDSIADAAALLAKHAYSGAPVLDDEGALVGMLSTRDIDAAKRRGQGTLPVAGCMSHEVITIGADAPLPVALEMMERHDVGRLPVVSSEGIVGIVTRTDALASLYGA